MLETDSQIVVADFVEGGDDIVVSSICPFHFVLRGNAPYLCGEEC